MFTAILAASFLVRVDPPQEKGQELTPEAKKELQKLEGKWKIVKGATSRGEEELDSTRIEVFMVFKGTELTTDSSNQSNNREKKETLTIRAIDPSTDPPCIDLVETLSGDRGERIIEAVYKIDGDTLQFALCIPQDGKLRPAGFDKPTDPRTVVWVLKRVKN